MVTRNPSKQFERRGTISLQLLVIMVPVFFGFMGFALDLGRLYLIRGELNQAANAMAMAAANHLIGTATSLEDASSAANSVLDDTQGTGAKYNFGSMLIGSSTGLLNSSVNEPVFYQTLTAATAAGSDGSGDGADGTTARHVQVSLTADAPLLFWGVLTLGQSRSTPIAATAIAGISAPLCTACNIEPFAVAAASVDDTTDFGFARDSTYTLAYQCQAAPPNNPTPPPLSGTTIPYLLLDRYNASGNLDEAQQAFRMGAQGLILQNDPTISQCVQINGTPEHVWVSSSPKQCGSPLGNIVAGANCGLVMRFSGDTSQCTNFVTDIDTLAVSYSQDTDTALADSYVNYTGNGRRVITVAVVDSFSDPTVMTVLGFRQFLLQPNTDGSFLNPADQYGRFVALYIGNPVPLKAGRFDSPDGSCSIVNGPGKVVLHQ